MNNSSNQLFTENPLLSNSDFLEAKQKNPTADSKHTLMDMFTSLDFINFLSTNLSFELMPRHDEI